MKTVLGWLAILVAPVLAAGGCAHGGSHGARVADLFTRSSHGQADRVSVAFSVSPLAGDGATTRPSSLTSAVCRRQPMPLMASLKSVAFDAAPVAAPPQAPATSMTGVVDIEVTWRPARPDMAHHGETPGVLATLRARGNGGRTDSFTVFAGERERLRVVVTAAERAAIEAGCETFVLDLDVDGHWGGHAGGELEVRWVAGVEAGDRVMRSKAASHVFRW